MHTALLVSWRGAAVMIDCGADWVAKVNEVHPQAIVLTHAHPDHAGCTSGMEPRSRGLSCGSAAIRPSGTPRFGINWCRDEGVPRAVFTHCGSEIVAGDERTTTEKVVNLGKGFGVEAVVAYDGFESLLRS